jgi:serine/threonine protein kinase
LGKGAYGEVKLCKEKKSNQLFAMKTIHKTRKSNGRIGEQRNYDDDIKMEIAIMKRFRHPNVVPRSSTLYLVLEYMVSFASCL